MSTDERPAGEAPMTEEQWAMQDHADAVRRWLAEPSPKLALTMERLNGVLGQVDRLRAELAETRAAAAETDELREEAFREIQAGHQVALNAGATVDSLQPLRNALGALNRMRNRWRSVRGDAPAEPPADDEPKPWHGGPTLSDPATVSEGWDEQAGHPTVDSVGWDLTFGARVTIGRARERDEQTGAPLPAAWTFHLSLFDRDGAAPCTASLTKDVTPEQVRSYGEQLIALAGAPVVELPVTLSSVDDVAAVCLAHGLTERRTHAWSDADDRVDVLTGPALIPGTCTVVGRTDDWMLNVGAGAPSSLLVAAIEAARGGSR